MRRLAPTVFLLVAGCSSACARSQPPVAAVKGSDPPIARSEDKPPDLVPLSIRRLVAEQKLEIHEVTLLAEPVGDASGRARATNEVKALASELGDIEAGLGIGASVDSAQLDATADRLIRLSTRLTILHEALRVAAGSPQTAIEVEIGK